MGDRSYLCDWFTNPYLSVFGPNAGKYGPEKTPYLDTFRTVFNTKIPSLQRSLHGFLMVTNWYSIVNISQDTLHEVTLQGSFAQKITFMKLNRFKNESEQMFCESSHSLLRLENAKKSWQIKRIGVNFYLK